MSLNVTQSQMEQKALQMKCKSRNSQYKRTVKIIIKNLNVLACQYQAKVALVISRGGVYHTYQSSEREPWQPSLEEIVSLLNPINI